MPKREDETWSNQKWKSRKQVSGTYVSWLHMDLYKILLNLLFFGLLILMIWSGVRLFSGQFFSPLMGSSIFLGEITGFVFLSASIKKNSWRSPSLFLTFLALLIIFVVLSFAGVRPMSDWKNNVFYSAKEIKTDNRQFLKIDPILVRFSGKYVATVVTLAGIGKQTIIFDGNTMIFNNDFGKKIYEYTITSDLVDSLNQSILSYNNNPFVKDMSDETFSELESYGLSLRNQKQNLERGGEMTWESPGTIILKDTSTGISSIQTFQYNKDYNFCIINGVEYYKEGK